MHAQTNTVRTVGGTADILLAVAALRRSLSMGFDGLRDCVPAGKGCWRGGGLGFELWAGPATALTALAAVHFIHTSWNVEWAGGSGRGTFACLPGCQLSGSEQCMQLLCM